MNLDVIEKNWVEGATLDKMVRKLLFEETLGLRHDTERKPTIQSSRRKATTMTLRWTRACPL